MDGTLTCCISVTAGFPRSPLFWLAPFQVPSLVSSSCVWCQAGFFRGASDCFCFRMCAGSFLPGRADRQGAPGPSEALPVWGLACWVRPFPLTDHQPAPTPLWCGWDPRESLGNAWRVFCPAQPDILLASGMVRAVYRADTHLCPVRFSACVLGVLCAFPVVR